ncbi:MAG TPA: YdcF family protein [Terracidiphilus sp.]|nr:YdcF family protein [Terracidiphilus sp.]
MSASGLNPASSRGKAARRKGRARWLIPVLALLVLAAAGWCLWVAAQIEYFASTDQAASADAIVVFGAAEYDGKPSPVYRARLDHAHTLYDRGLAPLIVTMGGPGGDEYTEGGVGREYLMGAGVPESALIAETQSTSTSQSARRLAVIARANHLRRLLVVSDSMHMFRIHAICSADGLDVFTSPRPRVATTEEGNKESDPMWHEILTYTLWRMHLD